MKQKRLLGLTLVSVALILAILACGSGTSSPSKATSTSDQAQPSATTRAAKATATEEAVVEPTEAPVKSTPILIKPTATKKATAAPTEVGAGGTATSVDCSNVPDGELGVAYDRGYKDNTDVWRVIGLICNNTKKAVKNIELTIKVFDVSNKLLHTEENVITGLDNVGPGEATPFGVDLSKDVPDADTYEVTITKQEPATLKRAVVDTQGVQMVIDDDGDIHLIGELVNNTSSPVEIPSVAAATYDSSGQIESSDYYSVLIHYLDPGKSGPFRITMIAPTDGATATDYVLFIDAVTTTEETFLISAKDDLTDISEFFDSDGRFHIAGELTNSDSKNVGVRLLATLYDKDGNILDAARVDTAISAIAPGEKIPYEFSHWGPVAYKKGVYDAYDKWRIQVDPLYTSSTTTKLVDLSKSIKDEASTFDKVEGTFTGSVLNDSGGDLASITVIVGIWGKKGGPDEGVLLTMGSGNADIPANLPKGKSATYTVYVPIPTNFDETQYEYDLIVKGEKP